MSFQLRISEGKEAGKEFLFDQAAVVIGRTPECDVCVYDAGVSRRHARICMDADGFFIEDLGSSNGTRVNGTVVKKQRLSDGDLLALGAVVFAFTALTHEVDDASSQSTRLITVDQQATQPRAKVSLLAGGASPEEMDKLARSATTAMPAVRSRSGASLPAARPASGAAPAVRPVRGASAPAVRGASPARGLSAAERARIRRQSSGPLASLKIFWAEASSTVRNLFYLAGALLALGVLAVGVWLFLKPPAQRVSSGPEPTSLTSRPITDSFGLGDDVTFEDADKKVFDFIYNAPVKAVVILHFQAKDISAGEVAISVNSAAVAQVPADTLDVMGRQNEVIVPPSALKKGETNKIMFDNLKNPPGNDPWRIWNVSVETALIPDLPPDQLVRKASESFHRGELYLQRKDIGAENRFLAWKEFREAWLMLEGYPGQKPELYALSKDRVKTAQQELDRTCAKLLLEVEGEYNQKDWDAARSTLEHVKQYFPTNQQACPYRAEKKRYELGL